MMKRVRFQSTRRGAAAAVIAAIVVAALAGCAGQQETDPEPSAEVPAEGMGRILQEREDDSIGGGAGGRGGGSVYLSIDSDDLPESAEMVEAQVFCFPIGTSVPAVLNGEPSVIECAGDEEARVLEIDASTVREARHISFQLDDEDSPKTTSWAVVFEAL